MQQKAAADITPRASLRLSGGRHHLWTKLQSKRSEAQSEMAQGSGGNSSKYGERLRRRLLRPARDLAEGEQEEGRGDAVAIEVGRRGRRLRRRLRLAEGRIRFGRRPPPPPPPRATCSRSTRRPRRRRRPPPNDGFSAFDSGFPQTAAEAAVSAPGGGGGGGGGVALSGSIGKISIRGRERSDGDLASRSARAAAVAA